MQHLNCFIYQNEIEAVVVLLVVRVHVEVCRGLLKTKVPVFSPVRIQRYFGIELGRQIDDDALETNEVGKHTGVGTSSFFLQKFLVFVDLKNSISLEIR